jgi:hypothetical protein
MQARRLSARHGAQWLVSGLTLFRANPALLSALTFVYFAMVVLLLQLPAAGQFLLPMFLPVMALIQGNGCRAASRDGLKSVRELVAGVDENRQGFVRLGLVQLLASLAVMAIANSLDLVIDPRKPEQSMQSLLILMALTLPLLLALWFSPLLVGWHRLPAIKAVFFSLVACMRNVAALLTFALALLFFCILLPGFLIALAMMVSPTFAQVLGTVVEVFLLVVMLPAINATAYLAYRDIFVEA